MARCERCERVQERPVLFDKVETATILLLILIAGAVLAVAIAMIASTCWPGPTWQSLYPRAFGASFTLIFVIFLFIFIKQAGSSFYQINLLGYNIIYSRDENGQFHRHMSTKSRPDTEDGVFLTVRVGGYFQPAGIVSPSRRERWKVLSSWDFNDFVLEDNYGNRIQDFSSCDEKEFKMIFDITKEWNLLSYIRKQQEKIRDLNRELERSQNRS